MRTAKSSTESQKANFFCDGGWPISERDVLSVTGTASAGAFLYDVYVIHLLCRESNWCDTVHSAGLALLLKEKLREAKPPLAGAKHYRSVDLPVDAGMGGWPGLETHPCLALSVGDGNRSSWKATGLLRDGQDLSRVSYSPPSIAAWPVLQWEGPTNDASLGISSWSLFLKVCVMHLGTLQDVFLLQETQSHWKLCSPCDRGHCSLHRYPLF